MRVSRTSSTVRRCTSFTAAIVTIPFLAACASQPLAGEKGDENNPWIVKIIFASGDECDIENVVAEPNTCGLPNPSDICVKQGKSVRWVSEPAKTGFKIFFDPLVGRPYEAPSGDLKVPIDLKAPLAMYKYTVTGSRKLCDPNNQGEIYDPAIRVDRP